MTHSHAQNAAQKRLDSDLEFQRGVLHLHALGPRPIGHFLTDDLCVPLHSLKRLLKPWLALDPGIVAALGGARWPRPPLRLVPAGEPEA